MSFVSGIESGYQGALTHAEIMASERYIITRYQMEEYTPVYHTLKNNGKPGKMSRLI